ncbi:hypothetical protein [Streptomyces sp. NPDC127119]|uniref:hypothetical protein n=1 Tax=Streptomyces sp. NPDC127119 TaxID=3345370 RepID=UPI00363F7749
MADLYRGAYVRRVSALQQEIHVTARRRRATFGIALTLFLAVSACSADQTSRSAEGPPAVKGSSSPRPPLTGAEIEAVTLRALEIPGAGHSPVRVLDPKLAQPTFPPVSNPSCQRILDVLNASTASALVVQDISWQDPIANSSATLASYSGAGAQQAFRLLRDALPICKQYSGVNYTGKYRAELTARTSPAFGDEAVSFHITYPETELGGFVDTHHVVVRTGVLSRFSPTRVRGRRRSSPPGT